MRMTGRIAFATLAWCCGVAQAAPCLTNPTDTVGNAAFSATVQSFIDLGIDPNTTCIENSLWQDPTGFSLGSYVQGADALGGTIDPTGLNFDSTTVDGTFAGNANARDFFWVQDNGNGTTFSDGSTGGRPSKGIVWDLGGQANQAVVFVQVDHGPVPGEVLENTVWLSNDPNAPDSGWTQAFLEHVYAEGWSPDLSHIADGFAVVYRLANNATFRYVSVTHGGPGAIRTDGDNEIDAVGGLTAAGGGVSVPAPTPLAMVVLILSGLAARRRRAA